MSLSSNQSSHYHSVTSGVASEFSETGTLDRKEKAWNTTRHPCSTPCCLSFNRSQYFQKGRANFYHTVCTVCIYNELSSFYLRKEAHIVGPGLDKITGSAQSGHKADRPDRQLYSVVLLFSTEGTVKQRGGILLLFLLAIQFLHKSCFTYTLIFLC